MQTLSIILPCAGEGTRLGLGGPKELYEVYPGIALIDYSLEHIHSFYLKQKPECTVSLQVIVVIKPGKEVVVEHVRQKLPEICVIPRYFNEKYMEWPGSVYSAEKNWSDLNIVLLPDSYLMMSSDSMTTEKDGRTLIHKALETLDRYAVIFGVIPCRDSELLKKLGAVTVSAQSEIINFQDKPPEHLDQYNGFWCFYGFRRNSGDELYRFLIDSVRHNPVLVGDQTFSPVGVVMAHTYFDLGEWKSIRCFEKFMQNRL